MSKCRNCGAPMVPGLMSEGWCSAECDLKTDPFNAKLSAPQVFYVGSHVPDGQLWYRNTAVAKHSNGNGNDIPIWLQGEYQTSEFIRLSVVVIRPNVCGVKVRGLYWMSEMDVGIRARYWRIHTYKANSGDRLCALVGGDYTVEETISMYYIDSTGDHQLTAVPVELP